MLSGKLPGLISILHIYYNHEAQRADFLCAAPLDSERPYCPDCFHSLSDDRPIHDYYYKPDPIFYGEGPRYFGVELGYLSHRTAICGLHVYISRSAFGLDEATQDRAIARVLYFFEKHWEELLKFSRCTPRPLRLYGAALRILDYAKKGYHGGRYTCINLQNPGTVEFRMFRGTLKVNTILATLQMIDRICDVALFLSDDELKAMAWTTFVSGIQAERYPQLVQYLKERQLYVNDPVEGEVED